MKKSTGLKKIAIRIKGPELMIYQTLAREVAGSKKLLISPGLTVYLLPDGTSIELYGPGSVYPDYLFAESDVVTSYKVADIEKTVTELRKAGARILSPIEQVCNAYRYCHLSVEGQAVFGIFEDNV
ncbi:VOC family protein [Mucilaginibacter rubeus]|uniref:VOC family protein n=1 Tax=Mucilaginibacter rubeus TaxID=2027860 RepID=A0A5C1I1L6_9SPHI|nr:hypothetical protein [Mucilaginibacter rubeus]QEM11729.1 hypothetical protein DEO27_017425 [Mucilaginibacter rubeus]